MQTIEYTNIDKSSWGNGPWQGEPDKRQWPDPATGLPCLLVRSTITGSLCGYVGVSKGHPFFGKDYDKVSASAHGGLTYAGLCMEGPEDTQLVCHKPEPGEPEHVWWLGFDCAHFMDLMPAMDSRMRDLGLPDRESYGLFGNTYKDVAYVTEECAQLAVELLAVQEHHERRQDPFWAPESKRHRRRRLGFAKAAYA